MSRRRRRLVVGGIAVVAAGAIAAGVVAAQSHASLSTALAGPAQHLSAPGAASAPFAVTFPAPPIVTHARMHLAGLPFVATAYTSFSGSQIFSATVYPFPLGKVTMTAQQFLENFAQRTAAKRHFSIPGSSQLTFGGFPALVSLYRSPDGKTYVKALAVLDGHIGYVLTVSGNSPAPAGYDRFVNSFSIAGT